MTTLTPITCEGSTYRMGQQYGEACRETLHQSVEDFFTLFSHFPLQPDRQVVTESAMRLLEAAQSFDPLGVDFIRGQAEGAGLAFEEIFPLHCFLEVMFNYNNLPAMCTSFAVTDPATRDGKTIVGQNADWFTCSTIDLLHLHHEDGGTAYTVCLLGVPYYHLTSASLCNCANMTVGPQISAPQVPLSIYLAKAMREPTLERAMAVLRSEANGLAYFHVADGSGAIQGIESVPGRHVLLKPNNGVLVHANHYESEEFKPLDGGLQIVPDSPARARRMREIISARYGQITVKDMMDVLKNHDNSPGSICRHPDPNMPPTLASDSRASIIMSPDDGVLWVSHGPPCENNYGKYSL